MTNGDFIRNMSNEELAAFIAAIDNNECTGDTVIADEVVLKEMEDIEKWLESECD